MFGYCARIAGPIKGVIVRRILTRLAAFAVTACLCILLSGCSLTRLHVFILDFFPSQVLGVRVYRVEPGTGKLVRAGRIVVGEITRTKEGETVPCTHYTPDGKVYGPISSPVRRRVTNPDALELWLPFVNPLASGNFRVASFNAAGTSGPSEGQVFAYGS